MRLVVDALSARQGGGQTYLQNLLAEFPQANDEVFIFIPRSFRLDVRRPDMSVIRAGAWGENPLLRALWQRFFFPRVLRRLRAEVLFCPGGLIFTHAPAGCRTVTMFRNMIPFDRVQRARYPFGYTKLRNWLLEHLLLSSMQRADLVIFISEYARAVIEKRAPGIIRAAAVIPHGVAHRFRNDGNKAARPFRLPPGEYLLCVSSIDRYKAQIEVVRAYALLRDRRPRLRHYLVLAGPENDHGYANEVRAEITRFGLDGLVLMTGAIPYEELPGLYQHATAHIFASESENCPNILLEAMASGRPVVSSDLPPMPEFGGDAVAYFDPRRPEDLANQLVTVLESAPRADELSRRSMEQSTRHDWRSAAYRTRDALASTTGERTARNGIPART